MTLMAAVLEYDGAAFAGWQAQANQRTVQSVLEGALMGLGASDPAVHASGRTDTGVHATYQCIHFQGPGTVPPDRVAAAVNAMLPADVAVRAAWPVAPAFHARHSALERTYLYRAFVSTTRSPLRERRALRLGAAPALRPMLEAATAVEGTHDFTALCSADSAGESRTRTVAGVLITELGDEITFEVTADGFLRRMVRTIVGCLLDAGFDRMAPSKLARLLADRDRAAASAPVPAHGLELARVRYPADFGFDRVPALVARPAAGVVRHS
ncbi:MAG: tRNA pseudouridine(38-40) synthase TruA [Candidatus Dormibacteria bacterium]